jgi:plastocyanin
MFRWTVLYPAARLAAACIILSAAMAPSHAVAAIRWTVIVGGHTPDNSVYANGFFPRELTVRVGDTVTWKFDGYHNVTFLGGGPKPSFAIKSGNTFYGNPDVFFPAGGGQYAGTGLHVSGTPQDGKPFSYSLTFTKPGRYQYACTIHPGMTGIVNVVQNQINESPASALARGQQEQVASVNSGVKAYDGLNPQRRGTRVIVTLMGNSQDRYSLLRFTRVPLVVSVGTTVTWTVRDPFEIHTVTFTSASKPPVLIIPKPQGAGLPKLLLNATAVTPTTAKTYSGKGYVNSGLLYPVGTPGNPSSFSLTFMKPGRYVYWCIVHADVGQKGIVVFK